ncbi:enterochelin esterase domain-containing protein, partial [Atlantibacter subterranea]|uniref:enterochelin esterase domain-containing protein n=1 Tax=Atlantibacter subterraneus TaxID=255519 RepID=UPI002FDEBA84
MVEMLLETGSEAWWQARQRQGIPCIEPLEKGKCRVTFWWRDPAGDERHSAVKRVWLNITGVTDHHQRARPVTLARHPGTDAWHYQLELTDSWRGSYCLIPSTATDDFPPEAFTDDLPSPMALRAGWRKLFPQAQVDPFN